MKDLDLQLTQVLKDRRTEILFGLAAGWEPEDEGELTGIESELRRRDAMPSDASIGRCKHGALVGFCTAGCECERLGTHVCGGVAAQRER